MSAVAHRYFSALIERLEQVRDTQGPPIERAAEACARSIAEDKLVFTFGTGHGALPALEMFPRTGTIVGFRPIVESTMISFHRVWGDMGARQYRFIHAVEGYGKAILRSHHLDPGDSIVLFSHSGVNAVILDIALGAKEKGLTVIGVTSLPHSSASPSRHSSGKRLYEVADVVIDTGASLSDASIRIEGLERSGRSEFDQRGCRHRARDRLDDGREAGAAGRAAIRHGQPEYSRQRGRQPGE